MTVASAAAALELKPSTVYALVASGQLAHCRLGPRGGAIRISEVDVEAYRAARRVEAGEAAPEGKRPNAKPSGDWRAEWARLYAPKGGGRSSTRP
jgi:excisionase family DNA binding protein